MTPSPKVWIAWLLSALIALSLLSQFNTGSNWGNFLLGLGVLLLLQILAVYFLLKYSSWSDIKEIIRAKKEEEE